MRRMPPDATGHDFYRLTDESLEALKPGAASAAPRREEEQVRQEGMSPTEREEPTSDVRGAPRPLADTGAAVVVLPVPRRTARRRALRRSARGPLCGAPPLCARARLNHCPSQASPGLRRGRMAASVRCATRAHASPISRDHLRPAIRFSAAVALFGCDGPSLRGARARPAAGSAPPPPDAPRRMTRRPGRQSVDPSTWTPPPSRSPGRGPSARATCWRTAARAARRPPVAIRTRRSRRATRWRSRLTARRRRCPNRRPSCGVGRQRSRPLPPALASSDRTRRGEG